MRKTLLSLTFIAAVVFALPATAAELCISLTIGAQSHERCVSPTDARAVEWIDDIRHFGFNQVPDGAGGTRVMTREEAAGELVDRLVRGQVESARSLKRRRIDAQASEADDLEGNLTE